MPRKEDPDRKRRDPKEPIPMQCFDPKPHPGHTWRYAGRLVTCYGQQ